MAFRITCDDGGGGVILRVEGHLLGEAAAQVLREQIDQASARGSVVVDLRDVVWYGDACLAILQECSGRVSLIGGGALLATLIERRPAQPPTA